MVDALYDKEVECPYCGRKFKTKKVRTSKVAVNKRDADFCIHYDSADAPIFYEINVCPACAYAFSANTAPLTSAGKVVLAQEYIAKVGSLQLCGSRTLDDALKSYKLALLCASIINEAKVNTAGICMRIAWLYRFQGNEAEEKKFLGRAEDCYQAVYTTENPDPAILSKQKLLYLLGELNGRLDRLNEARTWFNLLFSERNIDPALKNLARQQWDIYKEDLREREKAQ